MSKAKGQSRRMVYQAIRSGRITKPDHCEHCGLIVAREKPHELQAHHEDYSRPLEVQWLCYSCHRLKDNVLISKAFLSFDPKHYGRRLRDATQEHRKREWLNGIPEKYRS